MGRREYHAHCLFSLWRWWAGGWRGPCDRLPHGIDQKISDWLMIKFLWDVETAMRSGIKSRFGIMGFNTSGTLWAYGFLLNTLYEQQTWCLCTHPSLLVPRVLPFCKDLCLHMHLGSHSLSPLKKCNLLIVSFFSYNFSFDICFNLFYLKKNSGPYLPS